MISQLLDPQLNTREALKEDDRGALQRLVTPLLAEGVRPDIFTITNIEQLLDKTRLTVVVDKYNVPVKYWPYAGEVQLTYSRVKLDDVVSTYGNVVRIDLPNTVRGVMASYFSTHGLFDRSTQFVDGPISTWELKDIVVAENSFLLSGSAQFNILPVQRLLGDVLSVAGVAGFRTLVNFESSAIDLIVSQLNDNNPGLPYPLQSMEMSLSNPQVLTGYVYDNTSVIMTASGDGQYLGSQEIVYSRFNFAWYNGGEQFYIEGPSRPTVEYILDQVSAATGYPLSISDVVETTYPIQSSGQLETLSVSFRPDNLRYVGEITVDYRAQ